MNVFVSLGKILKSQLLCQPECYWVVVRNIVHGIISILISIQNKHQNQKVTIKHMYSKKQNGNGGKG